MSFLKHFFIGFMMSLLVGCSFSSNLDNSLNKESESASAKNRTTITNESQILNDEWYFFHKHRSYRFRLQGFKKDENWKNRVHKLLNLNGFNPLTIKYDNPKEMFNLFKKTQLQDVKLLKKNGISTSKGYKVPVYFYEINAKSPYGVGRYTPIRMLNRENLDKILGCLKLVPRYKEAWASMPLPKGYCFLLNN